MAGWHWPGGRVQEVRGCGAHTGGEARMGMRGWALWLHDWLTGGLLTCPPPCALPCIIGELTESCPALPPQPYIGKVLVMDVPWVVHTPKVGLARELGLGWVWGDGGGVGCGRVAEAGLVPGAWLGSWVQPTRPPHAGHHLLTHTAPGPAHGPRG